MYAIIEKREFYGPQSVRELLTDVFGMPETFADQKAARAKVRELDGAVYYLAHNESGRPSYTVHRVDRLARRFRDQIVPPSMPNTRALIEGLRVWRDIKAQIA
jgi:hypothetical protein